MNPSISVVIPTYNREEVLRMTIQQFLDQDRKPDEILVIDQSVSHLEKTREDLDRLNRSGAIRLIRQEEPNPCRARNVGIREAKGEIVLIVDDDILIKRDFVRRHLLNYGEKDLVAVNGAIWWERGSNLEPLDKIPDWMLTHPFGWTHIPATLTLRTEISILRTCNCSVLRSAAIAVGGLDECFGRASLHGDLDFGRKFHLAGGRIAQDPTAGIYHLKAPSGGTRTKRRFAHLPLAEELKSLLYFYLKNWQGTASLAAISGLFRIWVLNRRNVTHPYLFPIACTIYSAALCAGMFDLAFHRDKSILRHHA
ncbi:MAG: glycosyltransferase family 2 protein [Nitrospirae bacterium]|nr:glycosyltransferase family 2 protein [Nitrospirota bacterium]